jgi:hypothetical protein
MDLLPAVYRPNEGRSCEESGTPSRSYILERKNGAPDVSASGFEATFQDREKELSDALQEHIDFIIDSLQTESPEDVEKRTGLKKQKSGRIEDAPQSTDSSNEKNTLESPAAAARLVVSAADLTAHSNGRADLRAQAPLWTELELTRLYETAKKGRPGFSEQLQNASVLLAAAIDAPNIASARPELHRRVKRQEGVASGSERGAESTSSSRFDPITADEAGSEVSIPPTTSPKLKRGPLQEVSSLTQVRSAQLPATLTGPGPPVNTTNKQGQGLLSSERPGFQKEEGQNEMRTAESKTVTKVEGIHRAEERSHSAMGFIEAATCGRPAGNQKKSGSDFR